MWLLGKYWKIHILDYYEKVKQAKKPLEIFYCGKNNSVQLGIIQITLFILKGAIWQHKSSYKYLVHS